MLQDTTNGQIEAMLRSHVEVALKEIWEQQELITDDDGDYPFRADTSACWVRVVGGDEPSVQVFAHAACGVPRSVKMLAEVNELNRKSRWTKLFWVNGYIISEASLHWTSVDRAGLERLMGATCAVCDDIGPMVATVYGGATPLQPEPASSDEDAA